jgi:hypothetical protein
VTAKNWIVETAHPPYQCVYADKLWNIHDNLIFTLDDQLVLAVPRDTWVNIRVDEDGS